MRSRLITAFAMAAVLVGVILYAPPTLSALCLGAMLLIGAWEWSAFLSVSGPLRVLYTLALAGLAVAAWRYTEVPGRFVLLMDLALSWWCVAFAWIVWAPMRASRLSAALAGMLALVPTWVALVRIDAGVHGGQWTLFVLAIAFAADTGAFFAGRYWGRTPLAPQISPNKTWEGVIGGLVLTLAVAMVGARWFGQPLQVFVPLCLAAASFSVVGDLTESLLKRHVHLKDSGRLFPGHGGVLDRIDSITAATPVMTLGLIWLGAGR